MNNISTVISILITIAIIIFVIYVLNAIFRIKIVKNFIDSVIGTTEITFFLICLWFFFYPVLFFTFLKDAYLKKRSKADKEGLYFVGWRQLFGLHVPILLLWIALWLYIFKFIMIEFLLFYNQ